MAREITNVTGVPVMLRETPLKGMTFDCWFVSRRGDKKRKVLMTRDGWLVSFVYSDSIHSTWIARGELSEMPPVRRLQISNYKRRTTKFCALVV